MALFAGAMSLPHEVVEAIFLLTVQNTNQDTRSWTALTLSHVCAQFRNVALACPYLWTRLSRKFGRPGLAFIEACVQRSRGRPLEVVLYFYRDAPRRFNNYNRGLKVDELVRIVVPECGRWQRLSSQIAYGRFSDNHTITYLDYDDYGKLTRNLSMPMLEEISVAEQKSQSSDIRPEFRGMLQNLLPPNRTGFRVEPWSLPRLRALVLQNISTSTIPPALRAQLRSLVYQVEAHYMFDLFDQLQQLQHLSTEAASLETFRLSFLGYHFTQRSPSTRTHGLQHVKHMFIDFINCSQSVTRCLWRALGCIRVASLVELTIVLTIGENSFVRWDGVRWHDTTLINIFAVDPRSRGDSRFPSLDVLDIDVRPGPRRGDEGVALLLPHVFLPPSLKHLRLKSPLALSISYHFVESEEDLLPFQSTIGEHVALRSITFDLPRSNGVAPWVKELASKMKEQHDWDQFRELTTTRQGCLSQIILRDEVEVWCEGYSYGEVLN